MENCAVEGGRADSSSAATYSGTRRGRWLGKALCNDGWHSAATWPHFLCPVWTSRLILSSHPIKVSSSIIPILQMGEPQCENYMTCLRSPVKLQCQILNSGSGSQRQCIVLFILWVLGEKRTGTTPLSNKVRTEKPLFNCLLSHLAPMLHKSNTIPLNIPTLLQVFIMVTNTCGIFIACCSYHRDIC